MFQRQATKIWDLQSSTERFDVESLNFCTALMKTKAEQNVSVNAWVTKLMVRITSVGL
jgi:hypothetical protein